MKNLKTFNGWLYAAYRESAKRYQLARRLEAADIRKNKGGASCDDYFYDVLRMGAYHSALERAWTMSKHYKKHTREEK